MKHIYRGFCLLAGLAALSASAEIFPTGTFVVTGLAKNYEGTALGSDSGALLQLVDAGGRVVGDSYFSTVTAAGRNYRIEVPLDDTGSGLAVRTGDTLRFASKVNGVATQISTKTITVGDANTALACNVCLASYSGTNRVPDEYIAEYAAYIAAHTDVTGGAWSDSADWDGDGASNYAEFVAGSDPTDASDRLRITAIAATGSGTNIQVALTFEYAGGRVYAVKGATEPADRTTGKGAYRKFQEAPKGSGAKTWASPATEYDVKTIYLQPLAESPERGVYWIIVNPDSVQ